MGEALTCCQEKDRSKDNIEEDAFYQQKSADSLASDEQQKKDENSNQDNQNGKQKKKLKKVDLIQSDIKDTSDSDLIQSFKKNWQDADLGTKSRKLVVLKFKESSALNEIHKTSKIKDALEDQSLKSSQLYNENKLLKSLINQSYNTISAASLTNYQNLLNYRILDSFLEMSISK